MPKRQLRAQFFVDAALVALSEKKKIRFAKGGEKGIGVARLNLGTAIQGEDQVVGINRFGFLGRSLKKARAHLRKLQARLALLMHRNNFDCDRFGMEHPNHHAAAICQDMHPQKIVRRAMPDFDKAVGFCAGQNHKAKTSYV